MRAVILAGGRGTCLAPYTTVLPKPLMPIGDLPVLAILIRRLRAHGFCELTLSVDRLAGIVRAYCGDGSQWDLTIEYSQEPEPLGTAGPLSLLSCRDETLLVVNRDLMTDLDFREFTAYHHANSLTATVGIFERRFQLEFGIIQSSDGTLLDYIERPEHGYLARIMHKLL